MNFQVKIIKINEKVLIKINFNRVEKIAIS